MTDGNWQKEIEGNKLLAGVGKRAEYLVKGKFGTLAHREKAAEHAECGQCWPDCQCNHHNHF